MDFISNNSLSALQKSLDATWMKMSTHMENIANSTTPGYQAKYVAFEEQLKRNLKGAKTSSEVRSAIEKARIRVGTSKEESLKLDGNNVITDAEYVELARAQIQYEYLVQQVNDQITRLHTVINGR